MKIPQFDIRRGARKKKPDSSCHPESIGIAGSTRRRPLPPSTAARKGGWRKAWKTVAGHRMADGATTAGNACCMQEENPVHDHLRWLEKQKVQL